MEMIIILALICFASVSGQNYQTNPLYRQSMALSPFYDNYQPRFIPYGGIFGLISTLKGLPATVDNVKSTTEDLQDDYESVKEIAAELSGQYRSISSVVGDLAAQYRSVTTVTQQLAAQYRTVITDYNYLKLRIQQATQQPSVAIACTALGGLLVDKYCLLRTNEQATNYDGAAKICLGKGALLATPFWQYGGQSSQFAVAYATVFTAAVASRDHWIGVTYDGNSPPMAPDTTSIGKTAIGNIDFPIAGSDLTPVIPPTNLLYGVTMTVNGIVITYEAKTESYPCLCQFGILI